MSITTGKVRASYVHIFQPRTPENGGDPKYSVTLLIPKTDTATINGIYAEIERAKQEGAQKAFNGNIPPQCRTPLYDGMCTADAISGQISIFLHITVMAIRE